MGLCTIRVGYLTIVVIPYRMWFSISAGVCGVVAVWGQSCDGGGRFLNKGCLVCGSQLASHVTAGLTDTDEVDGQVTEYGNVVT